MKHSEINNTKLLCLTALAAALSFAITKFIQIPIPLGYFNIGNTIILLMCAVLPMPNGVLAGALGSALADLISYPQYTLPTLVIKAIMPWLFYRFRGGEHGSYLRNVIAAAIATLVPLFGYTLFGGIFAGSIYAGFAQFPGLLLEYAANLILYAVIRRAVNLQQLMHTIHFA